jgi:hydrogenase/urease accessory protein HupE
MNARALVIAIALHGVAGAPPAVAHPLAPSLFEVREQADGRVDVLWKMSLLQPAGADLTPEMPAHCEPQGEPVATYGAASVTLRWSEDCGERGIVGESLRVHGLDRTRTDALVRVELADGRSLRAVLSGADAAFLVSDREDPVRVAIDYGVLGVEHILSGLDHLAFVLGLMLLVRGGRALLLTLTAFTLGHSVTLSAAVLGFVDFPSRAVEFAIAASIFILAVELTRPDSQDGAHRRPWWFAFAFGLLHGLGFAGALAEVGLPVDEIPLALFSFNVGIEIGQIAFVTVVWGALALLGGRAKLAPGWLRALPVYAIGSLAAFWCFERAADWAR